MRTTSGRRKQRSEVDAFSRCRPNRLWPVSSVIVSQESKRRSESLRGSADRHKSCRADKDKPTSVQVIQLKMPKMVYKIIFISFCLLHFSVHSSGRPLSKRTVSEMQLMHDVGQHQQVQERREWLQTRLRNIHNPDPEGRGRGREGRGRGRPSPADLAELSDLTTEEIQHALDFLEKLLESKQS
ncbi:unnamed protein product [Menidia menidia]|uniref:Parathyroid hormone n=1 Tax=Menidia menidia TaxID=238744 RepID=A0A8S4BJZ4_9TELE|nr:unnamed protein product [Menidia menidia]